KELFSGYERSIILQSMDTHWREHLAALDQLRQGIHLRGYAQKNPKQEYKREAFDLFSMMLELIKNDVTRKLMLVRIQSRDEVEMAEQQLMQPSVSNINYLHGMAENESAEEAAYQAAADQTERNAQAAEKKHSPVVNAVPKVGRNELCPCQSGKKYKHCHGKLK
ncbi:MAG: SEC-C domain-containing protein, partial [Burkholderiaceae bacterium]|nr:SEC-C domain-containing protein [Burkholderiaceae bacterium]